MRAPAPPPLVLSINDAASVTGLTHWQIRHAINAHGLTVARLGRRIFVPVAELAAAFGLDASAVGTAAARLHAAETEALTSQGEAA